MKKTKLQVTKVMLKVCFELSIGDKHFLCNEKQIDALLSIPNAKEHTTQLNGEFLIFDLSPQLYTPEWEASVKQQIEHCLVS